jgi:hypothetical protein
MRRKTRTVFKDFEVSVVLIGIALVTVISCGTTRSRYIMLDQNYPSREDGCSVDVFRTGEPRKEFLKISRLDVHREKTFFISSSFDDAWPELRRQACRSGADAIIDIDEHASSIVETRIYHVTATGIKYK